MRDTRGGRSVDGRDPSHPPSDPKPAFRSGRAGIFAPDERPVQVQLVAAIALGLVLVASGLFLWLRPNGAGTGATAEPLGPDAAELVDDSGAPAKWVDAAPPPVVLSDARVIGCHDRGPKVTPPESCDRIASLELALSRAIEQSAACFPATGDSATIEYVADVSFSRHKVHVNLPRAGRSTRDRKTVAACGAAVREAMRALELDSMGHQHARYSIAITATYRGRG